MSEAERDQIVETIAQTIEHWGMASPAILLADSHRPLAFLGSQFLLMAQPLLGLIGWGDRAAGLVEVLGDRTGLQSLVTRLERGRSERAEGRP